jgi:hypothetical protein
VNIRGLEHRIVTWLTSRFGLDADDQVAPTLPLSVARLALAELEARR